METLGDFIVKYQHFEIKEPSTDLEKEVLKQMCYDAAETIDRQCGREYGFGEFKNEKTRATQVYKLPSDFRKKIEVTNNVVAECNLSIFDHKAKVAKSRNYRFKAKGIRNDLVLHQSSFISTPSNLMKKLTSLLNKREDEWTVKQKLLFKKKIEEKMNWPRSKVNMQTNCLFSANLGVVLSAVLKNCRLL